MRNYRKLPSGAVQRARGMRKDPTEAEKRLWSALRRSFPQAKFRRQVPYGPYFAEFLSVPFGLMVEADGGQHAEATAAHDEARTRYFNAEGYRVLRFWNNDILANTSGVIARIGEALGSLSQQEREGDAKRRKGESDGKSRKTKLPSPSHAATRRGPLPLPKGEG